MKIRRPLALGWTKDTNWSHAWSGNWSMRSDDQPSGPAALRFIVPTTVLNYQPLPESNQQIPPTRYQKTRGFSYVVKKAVSSDVLLGWLGWLGSTGYFTYL